MGGGWWFLKTSFVHSFMCPCKCGLAWRTPPHFEGLTRILGPKPKGLTIPIVWHCNLHRMKEKKNYSTEKKDGFRQLHMWHHKIFFVGSQAPPFKGFLFLTRHHKIMCQNARSLQTWAAPSLMKQLVNHQNVSPASEREGFAVDEKTACGENPSYSKRKKRNDWNDKWH